ncbi:hypothetical protein Sjap_023673 [Stephania japonica]|uniref:Uncharacterized protein n=1 Tax=Stephania japonica TaxID=461633 RepID=A0AAP0HN70_9MAGN
MGEGSCGSLDEVGRDRTVGRGWMAWSVLERVVYLWECGSKRVRQAFECVLASNTDMDASREDAGPIMRIRSVRIRSRYEQGKMKARGISVTD